MQTKETCDALVSTRRSASLVDQLRKESALSVRSLPVTGADGANGREQREEGGGRKLMGGSHKEYAMSFAVRQS